MYDFAENLSMLVYPLGFFFILGGVAVALAVLRRTRVAVATFTVAVLWLWACSIPVTSERLRLGLEQAYPNVAAEEVPEADAIVVLGGAFSTNEAWPYPNASGSVDRYWHAARLYHAGRADRVILTGGGPPDRPEQLTEAEAGAIFLQDMGVPREALLLDTESRTTRDHVVYLEPIVEKAGLDQLLLVTSATHMRRAEAVFRKAGFDVLPVATDFSVREQADEGLRRYLPSAGALAGSTQAVHEYLGFLFYRMTGDI